MSQDFQRGGLYHFNTNIKWKKRLQCLPSKQCPTSAVSKKEHKKMQHRLIPNNNPIQSNNSPN